MSYQAVGRRRARDKKAPPVAPPADADFAVRLAYAQALVRHHTTGQYSVDDFLAERRREAAHEA